MWLLEWLLSTSGRRAVWAWPASPPPPPPPPRAEMGEICVELSSWWERSPVVLVTFDPELELESLELLWLDTLSSPVPWE